MTIDGELEDTEGVKESDTNFAKGTTEVKFDPDMITPEKILKTIENAGYLAKLIKG